MLSDATALWSRQLVEIVRAALASGEVDAKDLRTIVLAPTRDYLTLGVWFATDWSDYPYTPDDDTVTGKIDLAPWLDLVDRVMTEGLSPDAPDYVPSSRLRIATPEIDEAWRAAWGLFHRALTDAAISAATDPLSRLFSQPVGMFVNVSEHEATLVAFCHPHGAPLWPLSEQRKEHGFGSAYPWGAFTPNGMMIFYPEGEGDSLGSGGRASMRELRFDELVSADDYDDDGVRVRPKDEVFMVRFQPGHTHPERGGPGRMEVGRALRGHFHDRAPHLFVKDEQRYALPADGPALERFIATFAEDHEKRDAVETLMERHGVEVVDRLCRAAAIDGALWVPLRREFGRKYLEAGRAAEAMEHLGKLLGEDRHESIEAHALWLLGRHEEVIAIDPENGRAQPFRALSMAALGRTEEAMALLAERPRDEDCLAVRASILAGAGRIGEAQDTLRTSFLEGTPDAVFLALVDKGPLAPICEERRVQRKTLEVAQAAAERMPRISFHDAPRLLRDRAPLRVWAGPAKKEGQESSIKSCLFESDRIVAGDETGHVFELLSGGDRRAWCRPFEGSVRTLCRVGERLLASDGERLALIDENEVIGRISALVRGDGPMAVSGSIAAHVGNESLHLYRIEGGSLSRWTSLASPDGSHFSGVEFLTPTILAASTSDEVLIIDVSTDPEIKSRIWFDDSISMQASGDLLVIHCDDDAWFVSCRDPAHPIALARMRMESGLRVAADESHPDRIWILDRGQTLWHLDIAAVEILERAVVVDGEGSSYDDVEAFAVENGVPRVIDDSGLAILSEVEWRPTPSQIVQKIDEDLSRAHTWMRQTLGEWLEMAERPAIGVVRAMWYESGIRLECGGPVSAAGLISLGEGVADDFEFEASDDEDDDDDDDDDDEMSEDEDDDGDDDDEVNEAHAQGLERAVEALRRVETMARLTELVRRLRDMVATGPRMGRMVHLAVLDSRGDAWTVVDVVKTDGVPPQRAVIEPRKARTLEERLTARNWYREIDTLTARAKRDPAMRIEVLELLKKGLEGAASIALELAEIDPEGTRRAWIATAKEHPDLAIAGLLQQASHPDVRRALEPMAEDESYEIALPARRALGRLDEPKSIELIEAALEAAVEGEGIPVETLAALSEARLAQLSDQLLAAYEQLAESNEHEANELLIPLARSGVTELPESALEQAKQQRQQEELLDDGLSFGDDEPEPAVTAHRIVIVRAIEAKLSAKDDGEPLWPEDVEPEPHHSSWNRFFDVAWPRWMASGVLDALHDRLPARLENEADRKLALRVLYQDLLRGDLRGEALGAALRKGPYEGKELENATRMARLGRVQFGWSLMKAEKYAEARAVANAAVADAPNDGQVLFFEARLAWLEKNDPNQALARIPKAIERAKDPEGLGRLYNLYGAALDALGKHAESIPWFEKAMAADPSQTPMLIANIAEAHWKLGDKVKARALAEKAAARGSKAVILATILAADPQSL